MMNNFLCHFEECINETFKADDNKKLTAPEEKIEVQILGTGPYLLYQFDKNLKNKELFPFFKNVPGLKAKADYVLITVYKEKIYAIIIELKQKGGNPEPQIHATKHFIEYLIKSISRVKIKNPDYYLQKLELRGIKYAKITSPATAPKIKYDKFKNAHLTGDKLNLKSFLE